MKRFLQITAIAILPLSQLNGTLLDGSDYDAIEDDGGSRWYFNVDALWWQATEDNLSAATIFSTSTVGSVSTESAHVINPHFEWDVGYRIGAGYRPCGCSWDVIASWTHFDTKAKRNLSPGPVTETIVPEWGSFTPFLDSSATLSSEWHLHLNWVDAELNRTFCVDPCFELGVHGGLRGLWADQKFNLSIIDTTTTPSSTDTVHSKSNFSSIGIVAGLDASWIIGCGFSINAAAGGSLLYGRQKSHVSETYVTLSGTENPTGSDSYYTSRAMTDLRLGIGWEGCICDMTLALEVDWEHHLLYHQNQLPRGSRTSAERPRNGDIALQGATFSATLFF